MVYFGRLLVALVLGTQIAGAVFVNCGTAVEENSCKAIYDAVPVAPLPMKCEAGAAYLECMTPAITCTNTVALQALDTEKSTFKAAECKACNGYPVCQETTTTVTPWDSAGSSEDSGSGDSLKSSYSDSIWKGSSGSDSSGSADGRSSGSKASGSSGSFLEIWQWAAIVLLCCCCVLSGALAAILCSKKKPAPKPKPVPRPMPPPMPEPEPIFIAEEPLIQPVMMPMEMPLMPAPIPTQSTVIQSYSVAQPMTTSYAAPMTTYAAPTTYAAQPMSTSYAAQPQYATSSYAAPMTSYASPATYSQAAPMTSYAAGRVL